MIKSYEYKLSAVMMVYNAEKYLRTCIDSLINQTLSDIEIILVNDCSSDDSLSICKEYEQKYSNVKVIDKEKNEGLAVSGNLGISIAKGEYVTLVDNDDFIPCEAYEKLYLAAKSNDSDVVIGKANRMVQKTQIEMSNRERNVWINERTITNLNKFHRLFYDAFYWNKIFKRDMIIENKIELPEGKFYADRFFAHKSLAYSKKITIIPDVVYLWRKRNREKDPSLSQKYLEISNLNNRLDSLEYDLKFFTENLIKKYPKLIMWRVLIPIAGITLDEEFKNVFLKRSKKIFEKIDDVYNNEWTVSENLFVYLILNNLNKELLDLLKSKELENNTKYIDENNSSFYKLSYFRNNSLKIPDDIFRINVLEKKFIDIEKISLKKGHVHFKNIKIPKSIDVTDANIVLIKKTYNYERFEDSEIKFKLKQMKNNCFKGKIDSKKLKAFVNYDVFLMFEYSGKLDKFRVSESNYNDFYVDSDQIEPIITKFGNLSINVFKLQKSLKIKLKNKKIKIKVQSDKISSNIRIYLKNMDTKERVYFDKRKDNDFELNFKYFLDENSSYGFYIESDREKDLRIAKNHVIKYDKGMKYDNNSLKIFINENKNMLMRYSSTNKYKKILSSLRKKIKM